MAWRLTKVHAIILRITVPHRVWDIFAAKACGAKAHTKDTAHARDNPKDAHEREVALALLPELLV
jgi:hypothetical protein